MKCQGKFKFRGLVKKDGGKFTNNQGQEISYNESYALKLDEETENGVYERSFKVAIDNPIVPALAQKKLYEDIVIECDVTIYNTRVSLVPVSVIIINN